MDVDIVQQHRLLRPVLGRLEKCGCLQVDAYLGVIVALRSLHGVVHPVLELGCIRRMRSVGLNGLGLHFDVI